MPETNRREMLRAGAVLGAGIAAGAASKSSTAEACPGKEKGYSGEKEYTFGHTILFMEEYYRGTRGILRRLSGELDHIGELTSRAAQVIRNGGAVWHSMNVGHMPQTELAENRRGNPGIIKNHSDFPKENDLMLRDVSNDILHSHVPYHQGLVHAPEIPEIPICPSTTTGSGTLFWMLNAEIANKLADNKAKEVDKNVMIISAISPAYPDEVKLALEKMSYNK